MMVYLNIPRADFDTTDQKVTLTAEDVPLTTGRGKSNTVQGTLKADIYYRDQYLKDEGVIAAVREDRLGSQYTFWAPLDKSWRDTAGHKAEAREVLLAYETQESAGDELQAVENVNDSYSLRDLAEFSGQDPVGSISMPTDFQWLGENALEINTGNFTFTPAPGWTAQFDIDGYSLIVRPGSSYVADRGTVSLTALQHDLAGGGVEVWGDDFMAADPEGEAFAYSENLAFEARTVVSDHDFARGHRGQILQFNDNIETPEDESGFLTLTTIWGAQGGEDVSLDGELRQDKRYSTIEEANARIAEMEASFETEAANRDKIETADEKAYAVETFTRGGNTYTLGFVRNTSDGERRYSLAYGKIVVASFAAVDDAAAKMAAPGHADEYNAELKRQAAAAAAARDQSDDSKDSPKWLLYVAGGVVVFVLGWAIYRGLKKDE